MGQGAKVMAEKNRKCILCGRMEPMLNYICSACQDRIQKEVIDRNNDVKEELLKVVKEHGDKPGNCRGED